MEEKIKNKTLIEVELCGDKIEIASNTVETTPVKLMITKAADCDFVVIGERIKYTVTIKNECGGDLQNLKFKDELDECVEYVEGSFKVGDDEKEPELIDRMLTYEIEELKSCEKLEITFEVLATDDCCRGCRVDKSAAPTIRVMVPLTTTVNGTGISGSTVFVKFPNGETKQTTVILGNWAIQAPDRLRIGDEISAWQKEVGKEESDVVTRTVGR